MAGGRPTKYNPKYCKELINYVTKTDYADFRCFAVKLGIVSSTLYEWTKNYPEFSSAKKKADEIVYKRLLEIGYKALRLPHDIKFNAAVWIFMMKNQAKWRDKHDIEVTQQPQPVIIEYKGKKEVLTYREPETDNAPVN